MEYSYHDRPLDQGDEIRTYQEKLNIIRDVYHAPWDRLVTDGIYGRHTRDAVKAFQIFAGLSPSGILDAKTQLVIKIRTTINLQSYNVFQSGLTANPYNQHELSNPERPSTPPATQGGPEGPQIFDIQASDSSELATKAGRAKYIYRYLTEKGHLQQNLALGIMANMYRVTDGMPFPFDKLTIDYKGSGKQMGGGLLGFTYHRSKELALKCGCSKKIDEIEAYAKKFTGSPLSPQAVNYMKKQFPEGYPIPIDIQIQNSIDSMEKKCPSLKNMAFNNPKEANIAYLYNVNNPGKKYEKDPEKRKKNEGRWDRYGKEILRLLQS